MPTEPRPPPAGEQQRATPGPSDALGVSVPASALVGANTEPGPPMYLPLVTKTRLLEGTLVGVAMAVLAGVGWWAIVALTKTPFAFGALVVGIVVGQAVLIGARKGGPGPALVAGLACLTSLAVAEYFIQRSLSIESLGADLPLWQGFSTAFDVVRSSLQAEPMTGAFWAVAVLAAAVNAISPARRPIL